MEPSRLEPRKRAQPLPPPVSLDQCGHERESRNRHRRPPDAQKLARNCVEARAQRYQEFFYEVFHENTKLGRLLSARAYRPGSYNFNRSRNARQTLKAAVHEGIQGLHSRWSAARSRSWRLGLRSSGTLVLVVRSAAFWRGDRPRGAGEAPFLHLRQDRPAGHVSRGGDCGALYPPGALRRAFKVDGLDPFFCVYHYVVKAETSGRRQAGRLPQALKDTVIWAGC